MLAVFGIFFCIAVGVFAIYDNKKELFIANAILFAFCMFLLWVETQPDV